MVAIAAVVASKPGSSFIYYTKPVPKWLRRNPVGNFARIIALGAEVRQRQLLFEEGFFFLLLCVILEACLVVSFLYCSV